MRSFRDYVAFLRWHGVMVGKVEFNVAFYGLVTAIAAAAICAAR